jgi:hypothetical protein
MNQVGASPFKPPDWIDKIDIFGYRQQQFAKGLLPTITRFKIIEVKKDTNEEVAETAPANPIDQTMKYVDWIAHTRAGGDYSLVRAYLVTKGFSQDDMVHSEESSRRNYVLPRRPYTSNKWSGLNLVSYHASQHGEITLKLEDGMNLHHQSKIDS